MVGKRKQTEPAQGTIPRTKRAQAEEFARNSQSVRDDRAQVELAERRLGSTPEQQLRWVVEFAALDLDLLRPEERVAKGYDLRALVGLAKQPQLRGLKALSGVSTGSSYVVGPMPEETLRMVHRSITDGLQRLFSGGYWELPGRKAYLYRSSPDGAPRTRFGIMWETLDNEEKAVLSAVGDLVLWAGEKLRACPECGKVFVSTRRQVFCSTEHAQRARNQRKK